jgi:hypothetical protein
MHNAVENHGCLTLRAVFLGPPLFPSRQAADPYWALPCISGLQATEGVSKKRLQATQYCNKEFQSVN